MQVFSHGCSYLKRDSLESQISFCFTVFQENSSSSKAKRVKTVILHLFNHVDSFFRPWTKRMQYPILEKKKKKKKWKRYSCIPVLWFGHKTIQYCIYYMIKVRVVLCFFFWLIMFSRITKSNSAAFFLKSLHNFPINLNDSPRCQKCSSVHNTTRHNGSLPHSAEGSCFSEQRAREA